MLQRFEESCLFPREGPELIRRRLASLCALFSVNLHYSLKGAKCPISGNINSSSGLKKKFHLKSGAFQRHHILQGPPKQDHVAAVFYFLSLQSTSCCAL